MVGKRAGAVLRLSAVPPRLVVMGGTASRQHVWPDGGAVADHSHHSRLICLIEFHVFPGDN